MIYFVNVNDKSTNKALRADLELENVNLKFIVDTGASCSILDQQYIPTNVNICKTEKIKIRGINGITMSLGCIRTYLKYKGNKFPIKLHIVPNLPKNIKGLLGTDFLKQHKARIDFEENNLVLHKNDLMVSIPLSKNSSISVHLPARTEIITYIDCMDQKEGEFVVLSQELAPNVYMANSLSKIKDGKIPVRIVNLRNSEMTLNKLKPNIKPISDYKILNLKKIERHNVDRVEKLLKEVPLEHLKGEEKSTIMKICAKYSDIFC